MTSCENRQSSIENFVMDTINEVITHSSVVSMSRAVPSMMAQYAEANLVIS